MSSFLGRGLSFPVRLNDRDRFGMVEGDSDIRQAIYIIIHTIPGERVLRPNFGCEIHSLIFHPANNKTATLAERYVFDALTMWEPRIDIIDIEVTPGATDRGELLIEITYSPKAEHDPSSLVFPYYLLPDSADEGAS
ncbi:MAG: GPW/gp25 family protein [Anaerolineae bacterium]|nr:GPW/gp25 family protein [Anaerolineae bacterium]